MSEPVTADQRCRAYRTNGKKCQDRPRSLEGNPMITIPIYGEEHRFTAAQHAYASAIELCRQCNLKHHIRCRSLIK